MLQSQINSTPFHGVSLPSKAIGFDPSVEKEHPATCTHSTLILGDVELSRLIINLLNSISALIGDSVAGVSGTRSCRDDKNCKPRTVTKYA